MNSFRDSKNSNFHKSKISRSSFLRLVEVKQIQFFLFVFYSIASKHLGRILLWQFTKLDILNSFKYLLLVDALWLLVLIHIKPLADVWFAVENDEYDPVEATLTKFLDNETFSCQIWNGLWSKYKYLDSNFNIYFYG